MIIILLYLGSFFNKSKATAHDKKVLPVPARPEQMVISLFLISPISFFWFGVFGLISIFNLARKLPL
jgi:hypothetical protein